MSIRGTPADNKQSFSFNQPKDFKSSTGISIRNRGDHQSCAKRAGENKSQPPAHPARICRNANVKRTRDQKEPEAPLRMKRLIVHHREKSECVEQKGRGELLGFLRTFFATQE